MSRNRERTYTDPDPPKQEKRTSRRRRVATPPVEVKEPYEPEVEEFVDKEEFSEYMVDHPEEFDEKITTQKLNLKFKIPGYKLSRVTADKEKGTKKIILKKDYTGMKNDKMKTLEDAIDKLSDRFDELTRQIALLLEREYE